MIKTKFIYLSLLVAFAFASCAKVDTIDGDQLNSSIRLRVETDNRQNVIAVGTRVMGEDPVYSLKVYDTKLNLVASYDDYTVAGNIKLKAGKYTFVVESGSDILAALDAPHYYGEKIVTVVAGATNEIELSAKLANIRVSVEFSRIIKDPKIFSHYQFSIRNVSMSPEEIAAGRSIYLSAKPTQFEWSVMVRNVQGMETTAAQTISDLAPRTHYSFFFDVDVTGSDQDGSLSLDLKVDNTLTVIEDTIDVNLEKRILPEFKAYGFVIGQQKVIKDVNPRDVEMDLDLFVPAQTKEILMRHACPALTAMGLPNSVSLANVSIEDRRLIEAIGISWSPTIEGNAGPQIELSALGNKAPLGDYTLYFTVTDKDNQIAEATVSFAVLPDQDHFARSVDFGAKYATFFGEWCTLNKPEDLTFQYRKSSDDQWQSVLLADIEVTENAEKLYSAYVRGLEPNCSYVFRSFTSSATGNEITFVTQSAPEIPNLRFDEGYWDGKYWYPNATGGNSYWCTGNDGVAASPVNQSANTFHTDDAVSGKAVLMRSDKINMSISPVKFAAGNIFTGTYKTDMGNPKNSVKFGRQYTGCPLKITGWYKYFPKNINNDKNGVAGSGWGKPDYCHVYISLEDWGSKDASVRPSNPRVIGYGEFKTNQEVSQYSQFEIVINYKEKRSPTHVVMAATSSHLGGDFCGGEGSLFYIDELQLVWD